ncbi:MAG: HIT family protein [Balneolales bacterium]
MASIFTRIINKEIPSHKIAEDEHHFAFLDINPSSKGHTLVVPKLEIDYLFDVPDERLRGLITFAKPIAHAIDKAMGALRTGIIVEGLEVPHAHIHLIPIYKKNKSLSLSKYVEINEGDMIKIANRIKKSLAEYHSLNK